MQRESGEYRSYWRTIEGGLNDQQEPPVPGQLHQGLGRPAGRQTGQCAFPGLCVDQAIEERTWWKQQDRDGEYRTGPVCC